MILLLDTQLLLWAAGQPDRLPAEARAQIADPQNELIFSVVSVWEIAIKSMLGRPDFRADARILRRGLLENGYAELAISGPHALALLGLPALHKDPFDRMLIAQATVEGIELITADALLAQYPGPIRKI